MHHKIYHKREEAFSGKYAFAIKLDGNAVGANY